jgi:hypothetical protein
MLFAFMFNERTTKKGSDEVIPMMVMYLRHKLPSTVISLDECCNVCFSQSWKNLLLAQNSKGTKTSANMGLFVSLKGRGQT